jgi:FkbM family methyltransferase
MKIIEIPLDGYESIKLAVGGGEINGYLESLTNGGQQSEPAYKFFINYLNETSINGFIDLGASAGLFSYSAAIRGIKTTAIEMLPSNIKILEASRGLNRVLNLEIIEAAISREVGEVNYTGESAWGTTNSVGDGYTSTTTTLNELNIPADLLKIDIEGSELDCLEGARRYLKKYSPDLIIELNSAACGNHGYSQYSILRELTSQGYEIYRINDFDSVWDWSVDDYQEVIYADYFASKKSRKKISRLLNIKVEKPDQEKMLLNFILQSAHNPLHSWYHLATLDKVPSNWLRDLKVIEYLNKIPLLDDLEVIKTLKTGA